MTGFHLHQSRRLSDSWGLPSFIGCLLDASAQSLAHYKPMFKPVCKQKKRETTKGVHSQICFIFHCK